jgi:UDP-N-acetylmuramyl pentapeptide synthase
VLYLLARLYRMTIIRRIRIVAVVGSFGKTTTTRALQTALGCRMLVNMGANARSSLAEALLRIKPWHRYAVIEVGIDRRGEMQIYARMIRPTITVVTRVGSEHNSSLGTLEGTREEKAAMVRALPPSGIAVLNGDDPNVRWMQSQTRAKTITFGLNETNAVRATGISLSSWPNATTFTLHVSGITRDVRMLLIGTPMVYSLLAAIAVAYTEGQEPDEILPALERIKPTPGRLEPFPLSNGAIILRDDYKSALETVEAAMDVLAQIPAKRRIMVMGQVTEPPGDQGPIYRQLGERIGHIASRAIFICDRRDSACSAGAMAAGMPREAIDKLGRNLFKAIDLLQKDLEPGDVVLIKGRITERLDRIRLALAGKSVKCRVDVCRTRLVACAECPMLEIGWQHARPLS